MLEDAVTYQEIIRKGRVQGRLEEARVMLIQLGTAKFHETHKAVRRQVGAITDLPRLERLHVRALCSSSWDELLANGTSQEAGP
jgi:hypothetical protein